MKTRHGLAWLGVGVATLFWGGTASADIQTFWKTEVCPDFGGLKTAIAFETGYTQAPFNPAAGSVGGPMCVLDSALLSSSAFPFAGKLYEVFNAEVVVAPGDMATGAPGDTWRCVVCQYEDKVAAHPALSVFGTAVLMGGLVTAMLYELRKRQTGGGS